MTSFPPTPPNCGSKQIKAHVHFPWCWDGVNLDTPDHRSHMAYGPNGRTCPATHPVVLPRITLHVTYGVKNGTGHMLASDHAFGLPAGTSLHADFWQTWDQPVLDFLVERCLRGGVSCKSMTDDKLASMGFTAPLAAAAAAPTTAPTAVASPTAAHTMAHT